jgi:uncharacterized SAM-binding protein YcdF (DUF218 family)
MNDHYRAGTRIGPFTLGTMPIYDAILILGGGVRAGGELPPWAKARYDLGLELETGEAFIALSAGTTHRPLVIDEHGFPTFESVAGAQYLMSRGIPGSRLFIETSSWDTIGNAYFSRVIHVEPAGWRKLLIVTSEFHMPRTREIFTWVYGLDQSRSYELHFAESPDTGFDTATLDARRRKELQALRQFQANCAGLRTLRELHAWLFTMHAAYTPAKDFLLDQSTEEIVKQSY